VRGTEDELVLPVDTRIRFDVSAIDVLHSLWVPAFRT
jgi:heme/copper-type cytochrome/quinol oxidase subunit 2